MKIPKSTRVYCKHCGRHTLHKVIQAKSRERGALKKGSIHRARKRGLGRGYGNLGKYGSKPALSKWKRTGAKTSKKVNLVLTCQECKKSQIRSGKRTRRLELK